MGSCIEYPQTCPSQNDGDVQLLGKILQVLNNGGGSGVAGVSSISVDGGPPQTGAVSITTGGGGVTSVNGDPGPAVSLDSGEIPEGANLYFTEARVRATPLTGFVAAPGTVTAADTVLSAFEKLQGSVAAATLVNFTDETADADAVVWRNSGATEVFRAVGTTGFLQFTTAATAMRLHTAALDDSFTFLASPAKADGAFLEVYGTTHATGLGGATVSIHDGGSFRVRSAPVASSVSRLVLTATGTNGFFGIGQLDTPAGILHVNSNTTGQLAIFEQASADTSAFSQSFRKARGTVGTPSAISAGDTLGSILFRGYSGAAGYVTAASIRAVNTGTVASTRVASSLVFATATDAAPSVLTDALTINNAQQGVFNDGSISAPSIAFSGDIQTGFSRVSAELSVSVGNNNVAGFGSSSVQWSSTVAVGFCSGLTSATGLDTVLRRDAAGVLALSNTTVAAQTFRITETTNAGLTDYSRLSFQTQAGNHLIRTEAAGTGTLRILQVGTGPRSGTDLAGVDTIIHGGQPTGNAAPGAILFQQGLPAGASGAAVTALATSWQINTAGRLVGSFPLRLMGYTVATLPAGTVGDTAYVTDATAPTYNGALVGGGAVTVPVFYNGAAWVSA